MTATATKIREPLTLRDAADVFIVINEWIENHIDELELNGGALPDELAQLIDAADLTLVKKADAIAAKLDEFAGYAATAKATKDRAARREKVWNNAGAVLKAYALHQLQRLGRDRIRGASSTLRAQINSAAAVDCRLDNDALYAIWSFDGHHDLPASPHPLIKYMTLEHVVHLDKKRIAADYLARRAQLEKDTPTLTYSDIPEHVADAMGPADHCGLEAREEWCRTERQRRIDDVLSREFPTITVTRGSHLRVD